MLFWEESIPSLFYSLHYSHLPQQTSRFVLSSLSLSLKLHWRSWLKKQIKDGYGSGDFIAFHSLLHTTWFWLLLFGKSERQTGCEDQCSDLWDTHSTTRNWCSFFLPLTPTKPLQATSSSSWQLCQCLIWSSYICSHWVFLCYWIEGVRDL